MHTAETLTDPPDRQAIPNHQDGVEGGSSYLSFLWDSDAALEKYRASEDAVAPVRFFVIFFNSLLFVTVVQGPDPIVWLASLVIGISLVYSTWIWALKPYNRYGFLESSTFVTATDALLITLFLTATGGFASPFFPLWYVSVFALSVRFGAWETLAGATVYTFLYAGITAAMDGLMANLPLLVLRSGYIYLAAMLGFFLSGVTYQTVTEKQHYQGLSARLQETTHELSHALSRQEATLDATADGILVVDNDMNVTASNTRFQEMWNIPDALLAKGEDKALIQHVLDQLDDPDAFLARVQELYDTPEEESVDEIRFKDGRIFERYSRPQCLDGETVGRVWSFRDVTQESQARRETERANEELRRFASVAGHDLKEPARMVQSYVNLFLSRYEDETDEEGKELLQYAQEGAQGMQDLVQGLLRYARLDTKDHDPEPVDTNEVLDQVLRSLSVQIEDTDATIHRQHLPTVEADKAQLRQVFQNLVSNALKFARPEAPPRVSITAEQEGSHWRFHVEDNGIGIDPNEMDTLFEIFQQGKAGYEKGGEGLGLAICKKIIDRHGGQISVDSKPGKGSTFSFTLPTTDR